MSTSNSVQRFTASDRCPVCDGYERDERGQGRRCHGYLSGDRKHIFCSREEHSGQCNFNVEASCYRHVARGPCKCGVEHAPAEPEPGRRKKFPEIRCTYIYQDRDGKPLFEVLRCREEGKSDDIFLQRQPIGGGKYQWNLKGVERVLYGLPNLLAADPGRPVWIVEGEKDKENLERRGAITTCNPMGAGKWRDEYSEDLHGRDCIVIPDNDEAGRDHARDVANSLLGIARSVKVVEIPGLPERGDVSDFLDSGGTLEQLEELAAATPEWVPSEGESGGNGKAKGGRKAKVKGFSPLLAAGGDPERGICEEVDDPHRLATLHLKARGMTPDGDYTLRHYREEFFRWDGSAYHAVSNGEVNAALTRLAKAEFDRENRELVEAWLAWREDASDEEKEKSKDPPTARKVHARLIGDVSNALVSLVILPGETEAHSWLYAYGHPGWDPKEVIPCKNCLVHIPSLVAGQQPAILPPTPTFFNTYALDFDFDPKAPAPAHWLKFLRDLWGEDRQSIDTLQEWFGYCLVPDNSQEKILAMFGPKRSGKGTIAKVLKALIGDANVAGPTLGSLTGLFGLAPLINKPLAIIADARMSRRTDEAVVIERLLSISGNDTLTVDRKHKESWTGVLLSRLLLISNELPQLRDASGALPGRLILLRMLVSFFGREDRKLFDKLRPELPGILLWGVEGWRRLRERGHFIQPESGEGMVRQLEEIASPVGAFLREEYTLAAGCEVEVGDIFRKWCIWCEARNRKPGSSTAFGRDLRAVFPGLELAKRREGESRVNYYQGLRPKTEEEKEADYPPAK
jgi:putative DNA primase/helicase